MEERCSKHEMKILEVIILFFDKPLGGPLSIVQDAAMMVVVGFHMTRIQHHHIHREQHSSVACWSEYQETVKLLAGSC